MPNLAELGKLVKQKYPGSYDSMEDSALGRIVQQKYPGSYDQYVDQPQRTVRNDSAGGPPKGYQDPGAPAAFPSSVLSGFQSMMAGAKRATEAVQGGGPPANNFVEAGNNYKRTDWNNLALGTSDMLRGAGEASSPLVLTALGMGAGGAARQGFIPLLKYGAQVAGGVGAGVGTQMGTEAGLNALGVPSGVSRLGGDVASVSVPTAAFKLWDYLSAKAPDVGPVIKNKNTPERQDQMDMLKRLGVKLDKGQEFDSRLFRNTAQQLQAIPGASGMAQDFYVQQGQQLGRASERVVAQPVPNTNAPLSPPRTLPAANIGRDLPNPSLEPYPAGQGVLDKTTSRITQAKSYADKLYDSIRQSAARNIKTIQVGEKTLPASAIVDQYGAPALPERTVPVMSSVETPVDLTPFRNQLKPIYEDLARALPPVQQQNNPAFAALRSVMESPNTAMPAVDFDKFLGALKAITRDGSSSFLTNQSQGIAKQVVKAGETQLRTALADAGPNVLSKLTKARSAVKEYYQVADFMEGLRHEEPAALYSQLITGGDKVTNTLKTAQKYAPTEMTQVGKTFLQGLFDKATQQGGFNRTDGILNDWNRMGPETKKILFGEKAADVERFILAAKDVGKVYNPSGTAQAAQLLKIVTGAGGAVTAAMNPEILPLEAAGLGASMYSANRLGKALFNPNDLSLRSVIQTGKLLSRPMSTLDYYRTGAPLLPLAVRDTTKAK